MQTIRHARRLLRKHAAKIVITGFLALPMIATIVRPSDGSGEQRALAPAPATPRSLEQALAWPALAEAWSNDHFGWRTRMVRFYGRLRHDLFGRFPTNQVIAGREGRIFLTAHNDLGERYELLVACGWKFDRDAGTIADLNRFESTVRAHGIDARLLVVPSGPVVYSEELQPWQTERCRPENVPLARLLAAPELSPQARELIYFPLTEMRAMRERVMFFPKNYFHWAGAGAAAVAAMTERHFWGRGEETGPPIPLVGQVQPSDVHWMFPGIKHNSVVEDPDFKGTTITPCYGPACFPELRPVMDKLQVVGRYRNSAPGLGPRLVVITDSFGYAGGPMFSRYHREVVHVSTNSLPALDEREREQLRKLLFVPGSDDEVLFLYHDATVLSYRIRTDLGMLMP